MSSEHEVLLDIVRNRTEEGINPYITRFDLVGRGGLAGVGMKYAPELIDHLVRTDHLLRWPSDPADERSSKEIYLTLREEDRIVCWLEHEASKDDPNADLIAHLNQVHDAVRDDSTDE